MSLEFRRNIIAVFGCFQCTTVVNAMGLDKVNRGHTIDREEQEKAAEIQDRRVMLRDTSHLQSFPVLLRSHSGPLLGAMVCLIHMQFSESP